MKIALLGDIHANLPALEAVLEHAHAKEVEGIWNVGDWVGYGAFPNEVIALLRQEGALSIIGNYDLRVFEVRKKAARKVKRSEKKLAFRWTYEQLTKENRRYLRALSREARLEMAGKRILLTHGSPASNKEHLGPETPDERLRELAAMARADVVICGHSHRAFARKVKGVWFINTGSVGRPDDGDPRACYAILWLAPRYFRVRHYRVEYDVERAVAAIRQHELPEDFAQMILQGRSLDDIAPSASTGLVREEAASSEWSAGKDLEANGAPVDEAVDFVPRTQPPGTESASVEGISRPAAVVGHTAEAEIVPPPAREDVAADLHTVQKLSLQYSGGDDHPQQVTRLALRLFDELQPLHGLGARERFWLECAALLHDIGWAEGRKGHHKTSLRMILKDPALPFARYERLLIGSIARYHRRALPKPKHDHYAALRPQDQGKVSVLAALLRVADGLDCTHTSVVVDLKAEVTLAAIIIRLQTRGIAEAERQDALGKGNLLERVFGRKLQVLA